MEEATKAARSGAPAVSVVIPVYNVAEYLPACLESVCVQTLQDIEIICVDDGSSDESCDILARAQDRDCRIRVIRQVNAGPSAARNRGMAAARGAYVMTLDADDLLVPEACKIVKGAFEEAGAEIVTFGATCFPEECAKEPLVSCLSPRNALYSEFSLDLLFKEHARPYAWRTAFTCGFLERTGLRYCDDISYGEDQILHFMAYPRARCTRLLSDKLYRYRVEREGSLMNTLADDRAERVRSHVVVVDRVLDDWREQGWLSRYDRAMLEWALEFVALDVSALEGSVQEQRRAEFCTVLKRWFGNATSIPLSHAGRKVLGCMLEPNGAEALGGVTLARFYLERRGIRQCVGRVANGVLGR